MNTRALCLVLAAMSMAGCANFSGLDTQGQRLDANTLQTGKSLSGVTLSTAAWPRADWWKSLGDPQLDGLIHEALQNSPDMQVASARAHQDPQGQGDAYSTLRNIGASFNYNFDLWGGQRAAWEAALGQARAAEVDQQAARLTLAANVAKAYSDLGQAHIVRDLANDDLKRTRQMLDLSKRRLSSGIDSQYQYQQTESLEASAQSQLIDAEKQLQSAKIALAVLLGKGPDRGNELVRPNVLKPSVVAVPAVLPAELVGRRPDLIAARWRVEAASKNVAASKTRFYPNLNLSASAGAESLLGDAMFGSASRFFSIAPTISLPIFDGGRLRADLDARDADYDLAVAQYNKTLVQALGDIGNTLMQLRETGRQIQAQQHAADIAQQSYDTGVQRYSSGIGNYLDVLSIEQQLLQAQRQLATLNAAQIDLSIQLMQALGGGFNADNVAATTPATRTE
jgi:NodT family efflux transporter outer membrane factor (OMF) lipoprotein